jgi:sulfotransferase family protein
MVKLRNWLGAGSLETIRFANRRTKNVRNLRRLGIRIYSTAVRANIFLPPPRVLLNGPPKSGTHLLSDCLSLMPKMMFSGRHFALAQFVEPPNKPYEVQFYDSKPRPNLDRPLLKEFLMPCPQGMFVTAHASFHPVLRDLMKELQFKHILLLRDPRDVVVSFALSPLKRQSWQQHHEYYTKTLKSDEERIMATIRGFGQDGDTHTPLASIKEIYSGFIAWLDEPSTLGVRFERLVGSRGGGDDEAQLAEIERIGQFIGRPLSIERARWIAQKMYGKGSLTYRKGQTGDWQKHFTESHRRAFKDVAGDILVRLGYERDTTW